MEVSCPGLRAVVTAGGSGLGLVIATALRDAGAQVFVCDASPDAVKEASGLTGVTAAQVDVTDTAAMQAFFEDAVAAMGGLDLLVNNAGIAGPTALIEDIEFADWRQTIEVDLNAQFYAAKLAIPAIKAAGGGAIVNISSTAGRLGYPMRTPYASAKWGIIGLTQSLAMELGKDRIRVNAILPGPLEGERMHRVIRAKMAATGQSYEEVERAELASSSIPKFIPPADIAAMVCYLASPWGGLISGQSIGICGNTESLH